MEVHVVLSDTAREAGFKMRLFLEQLREQGVDYRAKGNQRIVIAEGKEFHFIIFEEYDIWNRGRTYYYKGEKLRSGYPVREEV